MHKKQCHVFTQGGSNRGLISLISLEMHYIQIWIKNPECFVIFSITGWRGCVFS